MKHINLEFSLYQTLNILNDEKNRLLSQKADLKYLDKLIEKTYVLMEDETLEDKVLLGSFLNIGVWDEKRNSKDLNVYLGFARTDEAISIFSPIGLALYGASIGDVITFKDQENIYDVVVFNKNVSLEKNSSSLKKVNYAYLASSKKNN